MSEVRGPDVVAAWGAANGLLLAILIGYGDRTIPIALYAGSVALLELIALGTWWVMRRHPVWARRSPGPHRAVPSVLAALVVAAVGVGLVWSWWMALTGLYPLGALAGHLATTADDTSSSTPPSADDDHDHHLVAEATVGAAAGLAAVAVWRRRQRTAGPR